MMRRENRDAWWRESHNQRTRERRCGLLQSHECRLSRGHLDDRRALDQFGILPLAYRVREPEAILTGWRDGFRSAFRQREYRSEERRVGKEGRSRRSPYYER